MRKLVRITLSFTSLPHPATDCHLLPAAASSSQQTATATHTHTQSQSHQHSAEDHEDSNILMSMHLLRRCVAVSQSPHQVFKSQLAVSQSQSQAVAISNKITHTDDLRQQGPRLRQHTASTAMRLLKDFTRSHQLPVTVSHGKCACCVPSGFQPGRLPPPPSAAPPPPPPCRRRSPG